MCEVCETYSTIETYSIKRFDPTRTTALRAAFARDMNRRFNELTKMIVVGIVENDCFGLKNNGLLTQQMFPPNYRQFDFATDPEKVEAFMNWLQVQVDRGIITVGEFNQLGTSINSYWTNMYILDSYKRGVIRAREEMRKAGMNVPTVEDSGGIGALMNSPFHMDRVGLLFIRTYTELQNITAAMSNQISKILSQGMIDGDGPVLIARKLVATINGTGMGELGITDSLGRFIPAKLRAEMLARTETIRAYASATLQEYRNWKVAGVTALAEFRNAGDDRVCPICESLQGKTFTLDEAEGVIPVHPNCRCAWISLIIENKNLL